MGSVAGGRLSVIALMDSLAILLSCRVVEVVLHPKALVSVGQREADDDVEMLGKAGQG